MGTSQSKTSIKTSLNLKETEDTMMLKILKLGACAVCGVVFGIAVEKGRVFDPEVVTSQMKMQKFVMMKMFLSALSSGMICMSVMSIIPATQQLFLRARTEYVSPLVSKGYMGVCIGAATLGAGMALVGTCPGIVVVQISAGVQNSVYTLLGATAGAVLYGLMEPYISKLLKPTSPMKQDFLYQKLGLPYHYLGLPTAAAILIGVASLEYLVPWKTETNVSVETLSGSNWFSYQAWPPYLCGALVGLLQVPVILLVQDTLGGSSCYCTVVSQGLLNEKLRTLSPYLAKFQSGISNWWQVFFIGGAVIGALASSSVSGARDLQILGAGPATSFLGGILIIFGARIARGCTSGHGLSGGGLLNKLSLAAICAMFAGGMSAAAFL